jgi:hypothetical protein
MTWLKTLGRQGTRTETVDHPNGGNEVWEDGYLVSVRYSTGDEIWLEYHDNAYKVVKIRHGNGMEYTDFNYNPYGE